MNTKFNVILFLLFLGCTLSAQTAELVANLNGSDDGLDQFLSDESVVLGNKLVYAGIADNGSNVPFVTDGTAANTVPLTISTGESMSNPNVFVGIDSLAFFGARIGFSNYIVRTNGTSEGTFVVSDFFQSITCGGSLGNLAFFSATTSSVSTELWVIDGSMDNMVPLQDSSGNDINFPCGFTPFDGKIFFSASVAGTGSELFVSDGTSEGTYMVRDINSGEASGFNGTSVVLNDKLYFTGRNNLGTELWGTDGTADGTMLIKDINPGGASSFPSLTVANGMILLAATDATNGKELWQSDGTAENTVLLADIVPGMESSSPTGPVWLGDRYVVFANHPEYGYEPFSVDNEGNVELIVDIMPGEEGSRGAFRTFLYDGILYFDADDGVHGSELWRTDGTEGGTYMLEDIEPGPIGSEPLFAMSNIIGEGFYFSATTEEAGRELYYLNEVETSTNEIVIDSNPWKLAPNPTKEVFNISGEVSIHQVRIYSTTGQLLQLHMVDGNQVDIDLGDRLPGTYYVAIVAENGIQTIPVVKL
jgi:ELWxxDGT repeat protein